MKRLLIPLLAALALPTAVNAFPWDKDLTIKSDVGEKFIIVRGTREKLLLNAAKTRNIRLTLLSHGMERRKINTSWYKKNVNKIFWKIKWTFINVKKYNNDDNVCIGRYIDDKYYNGHAWIICTISLAQVYLEIYKKRNKKIKRQSMDRAISNPNNDLFIKDLVVLQHIKLK